MPMHRFRPQELEIPSYDISGSSDDAPELDETFAFPVPPFFHTRFHRHYRPLPEEGDERASKRIRPSAIDMNMSESLEKGEDFANWSDLTDARPQSHAPPPNPADSSRLDVMMELQGQDETGADESMLNDQSLAALAPISHRQSFDENGDDVMARRLGGMHLRDTLFEPMPVPTLSMRQHARDNLENIRPSDRPMDRSLQGRSQQPGRQRRSMGFNEEH